MQLSVTVQLAELGSSGILLGTMATGGDEVTKLLERIRSGDHSAEQALAEAVYAELHRIAGLCMRTERPGHTLQPTALVNEAYARLCHQAEITWQNRGHFYSIAARTMRRILVDYARRRSASKRPDPRKMVDWNECLAISQADLNQAVELDRVLDRFAQLHPRAARVVEMKFFVGLGEEEIAQLLGLTRRTVARDWLMARAWLHAELRGN
jgi:RNA polymerase sigma factor (TIGR02999 family)